MSLCAQGAEMDQKRRFFLKSVCSHLCLSTKVFHAPSSAPRPMYNSCQGLNASQLYWWRHLRSSGMYTGLESKKEMKQLRSSEHLMEREEVRASRGERGALKTLLGTAMSPDLVQINAELGLLSCAGLSCIKYIQMFPRTDRF